MIKSLYPIYKDCERPGKQKNASVSNEFDADDGKMHLMKCDGTGVDAKPRLVWT